MPRTVLVVEDDPALNLIIQEILHAEGLEIWTASNGVDGYSCYLRHPTELVLTDVQMPELNGFKMMRCIRAINTAVRTIYLTGAREQFRSVLERETRLYGAAILDKPFSRDDLIRLINPASHKSIEPEPKQAS